MCELLHTSLKFLTHFRGTGRHLQAASPAPTGRGRFITRQIICLSPNGRNRRILPVAECPGQGRLTEPAADARPRGGDYSSCPTPAVCDTRRDRLNWVEAVEKRICRGTAGRPPQTDCVRVCELIQALRLGSPSAAV